MKICITLTTNLKNFLVKDTYPKMVVMFWLGSRLFATFRAFHYGHADLAFLLLFCWAWIGTSWTPCTIVDCSWRHHRSGRSARRYRGRVTRNWCGWNSSSRRERTRDMSGRWPVNGSSGPRSARTGTRGRTCEPSRNLSSFILTDARHWLLWSIRSVDGRSRHADTFHAQSRVLRSEGTKVTNVG